MSANVERRITFLAHNHGDHVAVAVQATQPGQVVLGYLDSEARSEIEVREPIHYGHKVALVDLASDAEVIEYGVCIGVTRRAVSTGEWVHTHNLRSVRWQHSA